MKKKICNIIAILLCSMIFVLPVQAADYGVIYDETESLWSEELEMLGEEVLPALTEAYGIDMKVDILTSMGEFTELSETAETIYWEYGYGYGEEDNGISLTLLLEEDIDGYALNDWYVYCGGDSELTENGPAVMVKAVEDYLDPDLWVGDMEEDKVLLVQTVAAMASGIESFISPGETEDTVVEAGIQGVEPKLSEETEAGEAIVISEDWMTAEAQLDHVTDEADLLSDEQWQELEQRARNIAEEHDFGVYIVTVDDYKEYTNGDMHDACNDIYKGYSLGIGAEKRGLLLLLSMNERDYRIYTYGEYGEYVFNQAGREEMVDFFLDNLGENDWYGAFIDYLTWSEEYLLQAEAGTPYGKDHKPMEAGEIRSGIIKRVAVILVFPLIVGGIVVLILNAQLKSVEVATEASVYMVGNLNLTKRSDRYSHKTESRRKIEDDDDDKSSRSSGGGSSTGGKF